MVKEDTWVSKELHAEKCQNESLCEHNGTCNNNSQDDSHQDSANAILNGKGARLAYSESAIPNANSNKNEGLVHSSREQSDPIFTSNQSNLNSSQSAPASTSSHSDQDLQPPQNAASETVQGHEAQNAATLKRYLLQGCGAKILVVLDQLGVTVSMLDICFRFRSRTMVERATSVYFSCFQYSIVLIDIVIE